jgi:baculoviral IAP repeat-containing protein 6
VAVSIQSLVFVPQPFFNEPSYESMTGAEGKQQSDDYSRPLYAATARWAMLDQMRSPPKGFESIVAAHFALKRDEIKAQIKRWAEINPDEINDAFVAELHAELDKQAVPNSMEEDDD